MEHPPLARDPIQTDAPEGRPATKPRGPMWNTWHTEGFKQSPTESRPGRAPASRAPLVVQQGCDSRAGIQLDDVRRQLPAAYEPPLRRVDRRRRRCRQLLVDNRRKNLGARVPERKRAAIPRPADRSAQILFLLPFEHVHSKHHNGGRRPDATSKNKLRADGPPPRPSIAQTAYGTPSDPEAVGASRAAACSKSPGPGGAMAAHCQSTTCFV